MATVDVVLTAGQSQMEGTSGSSGQNEHPATDPNLCLEWNGGPGLVQVNDPDSSSEPYQPETGSCLPSFTNEFTAASGRPIVVVRAAIGGTSLLSSNQTGGLFGNGTWDTDGTLFDDSVTRCLDAIADIQALGHTIGHVFVIWSQGYKDAQGGNDLDQYQAAQSALLTRWRTALSRPTLKLYIEEMYAPAKDEGTALGDRCLIVRDAQRAAVANTPGLEIAFDEGGFYDERGWLKNDDLHYDQTGLNYMGFKFGRYAAIDLGFTEPDETPPTIEHSRTSLVAHRLRMSSPLPPLPATFSTAGETPWVVPDFCTAIKSEAIGGGGPGAGSNSLVNNGGGGCGGAYAATNNIPVTPGETLTIVVGAGGPNGPAGGGATTPGGPSGIKRGTTWLLKADGGPGGLGVSPYTGGSNASQVANSTGDTKTPGTSGQNGGNSGTIGHGGAAASGGTLTGGAGATADTNTGSTSAASGVAPGGGGAGKRNTSATGGSGAKGVVYIAQTS